MGNAPVRHEGRDAETGIPFEWAERDCVGAEAFSPHGSGIAIDAVGRLTPTDFVPATADNWRDGHPCDRIAFIGGHPGCAGGRYRLALFWTTDAGAGILTGSLGNQWVAELDAFDPSVGGDAHGSAWWTPDDDWVTCHEVVVGFPGDVDDETARRILLDVVTGRYDMCAEASSTVTVTDDSDAGNDGKTPHRPCFMLGLSIDGRPWWNDLGNCPDYGSSDCPITMGEDIDCDYDLDDLSDILSYRFKR